MRPDLVVAARGRGTVPTGGPALPHLLPGGSSVVEQWTVKCSMQRSIGREFKSPSPECFSIFGLVGYDARFTRERSRVRSSEDVFFFLLEKKNEKQKEAVQHSRFPHGPPLQY